MKIIFTLGITAIAKMAFDILGWRLIRKYCGAKGYRTDGLALYDENGCYIQHIEDPFARWLMKFRNFEYWTTYRITGRIVAAFTKWGSW